MNQTRTLKAPTMAHRSPRVCQHCGRTSPPFLPRVQNRVFQCLRRVDFRQHGNEKGQQHGGCVNSWNLRVKMHMCHQQQHPRGHRAAAPLRYSKGLFQPPSQRDSLPLFLFFLHVIKLLRSFLTTVIYRQGGRLQDLPESEKAPSGGHRQSSQGVSGVRFLFHLNTKMFPPTPHF